MINVREERNKLLDDEDYILKKKRNKKLTQSQIRDELIKELKGYRKIDKNVPLYERGYHKLCGTSLKTMDAAQINDLIQFIINERISRENYLKEQARLDT